LNDRIPVIDLFAGPGGFAEGFSSFPSGAEKHFRICLSIEKDPYAHRTLELRSFFRQFPRGQVPEDYYQYLRKKLSRSDLFSAWPEESRGAQHEAWLAELGSDGLLDKEVDNRIEAALNGAHKWVLIGGPPCQAYSIVGRSRNKGNKKYVAEEDKRHFLYREYLRIIARHWPPVFVMENVKGILSSRVNGRRIFDQILSDLHDPAAALKSETGNSKASFTYKIFSLTQPVSYPVEDGCNQFSPNDFLILSEGYGVPQARHRVILVGVRQDYKNIIPKHLIPQNLVSVSTAIEDLPKLRSGLSREEDLFSLWEERVWELIDDNELFDTICNDYDISLQDQIDKALSGLKSGALYGRGSEFIPFDGVRHDDWFFDPQLKGVCNHTSKSHMSTDLHRYLFAACFAEVYDRSPVLSEFPMKLWPNHKNAHSATGFINFSDRFRVQLASKPATTVMSHIAKDGHYYIHYDASQCRSLTVREAARLQTFPDNYFFEGPRTQQYIQVGNAVPPLLAHQIAEIVHDMLM